MVSEFMLQQTQVSRVLEKFGLFIERFPTVSQLAMASEDEVLAAWSGLGYYRRARLLHAAAKEIVAEHGGVVPSGCADLQSISGIGRYTAGSIASIVFGENAPIVDGNVTRVLLRVEGVEAKHGSKEAAAHAWPRAETLASEAHRAGVVAAFNEGLMELGATVCTPKNPRCKDCPLAQDCAAFRLGKQHEIPGAATPAARSDVTHVCVLLVEDGKVLLEQRSARGMWARMWQPPTCESVKKISPRDASARMGVTGRLRKVGEFVHTTTHRDVRFVVMRAGAKATVEEKDGRRWFSQAEADALALSNAHRRIVEMAWGEKKNPQPDGLRAFD